MSSELNLQILQQAISGTAAALRCVTEYQPAGGPGDKVFPPTYEGGKYAVETRMVNGQPVDCVLLDSVQSQANRLELALLEAHRAKQISLPLIETRFDQEALLKKFTVTSLDAPHRIADAIFRDSLLDGVIFRKSEKGKLLDTTDIRNAAPLFGLNPTALLFGLWDSTGPRGGLGAKFQRALVSEIVGYDAIAGVTTSSRIDPAQIMLGSGPLYDRKSKSDNVPSWTLDEKAGNKKLGKDGKPSEANHGNVTPDLVYRKDKNGNVIYDDPSESIPLEVALSDGTKKRLLLVDRQRKPINRGGFTISKAVQTSVLSLAALRRLRFPLNGGPDSDPDADLAARTVVVALGLTAAALARGDADLRSRCQLFPVSASSWELLDKPGNEPQFFELDADAAITLLNEAIQAAKNAKLPWEGKISLTPSDDLVELVRRSQVLAVATGGEGD